MRREVESPEERERERRLLEFEYKMNRQESIWYLVPLAFIVFSMSVAWTALCLGAF